MNGDPQDQREDRKERQIQDSVHVGDVDRQAPGQDERDEDRGDDDREEREQESRRPGVGEHPLFLRLRQELERAETARGAGQEDQRQGVLRLERERLGRQDPHGGDQDEIGDEHPHEPASVPDDGQDLVLADLQADAQHRSHEKDIEQGPRQRIQDEHDLSFLLRGWPDRRAARENYGIDPFSSCFRTSSSRDSPENGF